MHFALTATLSMLVVLGIMVLVHEFGHFAVAKLCGVRVEVFSIGFGRRLLGFKRGDTDYRISLLPLGGYVKMSGENPNEEHTGDAGEFTSHPRWQRILIGAAGPAANFVLAFTLMTGFYMMHDEVPVYPSQPAIPDFVPQNTPAARAGIQAGDRIVRFDTVENPTWEQVRIRSLINVNQTVPVVLERNGARISTDLRIEDKSKGEDFDMPDLGLLPRVQDTPLVVKAIEPNMPALQAGLKPGDTIQAVNGMELHSVWAVLAYLQQESGKPVDLKVARNGQTLDLNLVPAKADDGAGHRIYRLGFEPVPPPFKVQQMSVGAAVRQSITFNAHNSGLILEVLKRMFTRRIAMENLSGPIGIARQTGLAVSMPGWQPIIGLMAVISLNLGIFNLLPIPILDGGLILLLLIEGTIRRDINQEFKERIYQVAFVALVLFAVFVMFNDFAKLPIFAKLRP
ncbi:MAG TPA: RIP metalloprotease RseP [Acidisarcina sp.]|nr:RIP metalloprotease RseP [Acidisarcina sp.]